MPGGDFLSFVRTDVPMTSALCTQTIQRLAEKYPFIQVEKLTDTESGRPVWVMTMGEGDRHVLYTAAHHANEWITATLLLKFAEDLAEAVDAVKPLREAALGVYGDDGAVILNSLLYKVGAPLQVGNFALDFARAESCGEGLDGHVGCETILKDFSPLARLSAVLVYGQQNGPERLYNHQNIVAHRPHIAQHRRYSLGHHQSVHTAKGVVAGKEVATAGFDIFEALGIVAHAHIVQGRANEFDRVERPEVGKNFVNFVLVNNLFQIVNQETRQAFGQLGSFLCQHLFYIYFQHIQVCVSIPLLAQM